jgi:hypothetical protein
MTMNELVEYIAEDLNTPSLEAKTRIAHSINVRYKQVTSSIGLIPSRRAESEAVATIGDRIMTFDGIEKVDAVFRKISDVDPATRIVKLDELTDDEMLDAPLVAEPPTKFSIISVDPTSVSVKINCVPETGFSIYANGLANASTLTSNDQPAFPESFHDILLHGVRADEYRRREKMVLAREAEGMFQSRLSDLRMFIAKSAYLEVYRGKHKASEGWWDTNSNS